MQALIVIEYYDKLSEYWIVGLFLLISTGFDVNGNHLKNQVL